MIANLSGAVVQVGLCVLLATVSPSLVRGATVREGVGRLKTGERLQVDDKGPERRRLLITRGTTKATMPLPDDVDSLASLTESQTPIPTITLGLERICPPARQLTLTPGDLEARFLLAAAARSLRRKQTDEAIATLHKALALAPKQVDVRLTLARTVLAAGRAQEAERILKEGMLPTPFGVYWGVLAESSLAPFAARLTPASANVGPPSRGGVEDVAWSASRRQVAFVEEPWDLSVYSKEGAEVFLVPLALGPEVDEEGEVLPSAKKTVARRLSRAEQVLRGLDFRLLALDLKVRAELSDAGSRDMDLSWVRFKDRKIVASMGGTTLRVRRDGKVVFERRIDTQGSLRLDWGIFLADENVVLLSWSHLAGSDTCPRQNGVEIVEVPAGPPGDPEFPDKL
jgi:hypothetical protein